ncbi:MAG: transglycosylase domain-containing protein [Thermoflavifilum sp.]|nr:transglycosylase domain-containing protein [Thermoflavifilum sp.]
MRRLIRLGVALLLLAAGAWYGIKFYYTSVHRIAETVRQDVYRQLAAEGSPFVPYDQIPVVFRQAVIATEDRSFDSNVGVDWRGVARALLVDALARRPLQGGSTITQQLVHNTLLAGQPKTIAWKIHETLDAIGLYDTMSKADTFALYVNDIYYGHGAYGLAAAAHVYFGRSPAALNAGELTMLAGLPNAPSVYDPLRNYELARQRQAAVIDNMVDAGYISEAQGKQILAEPIRLVR